MDASHDEIRRFLQAVDEELAVHAKPDERLELFLLGRSALIVRYGLKLATKDVDLVTGGNEPRLQVMALELFGKGTATAQTWGLYLEPVPQGMPPVPGHYRKLAEDVPGEWKVLRPKLLDVHDIAITKLKRFHAGDREDVRIMCDSGELQIAKLNRALASAFPFGMDAEENPDCKKVNDHLRLVIDYFEGRIRDLGNA